MNGRTWRKPKYNAKKCEYDGYKFDSMAERDCYRLYLKDLLNNGEIASIDVHPTAVELFPGMKHRVDFICTTPDGELVYYEFKGKEDRGWLEKKKAYKAFGKHPLVVIKRDPYSKMFFIGEEIPKGEYTWQKQKRKPQPKAPNND